MLVGCEDRESSARLSWSLGFLDRSADRAVSLLTQVWSADTEPPLERDIFGSELKNESVQIGPDSWKPNAGNLGWVPG